MLDDAEFEAGALTPMGGLSLKISKLLSSLMLALIKTSRTLLLTASVSLILVKYPTSPPLSTSKSLDVTSLLKSLALFGSIALYLPVLSGLELSWTSACQENLLPRQVN